MQCKGTTTGMCGVDKVTALFNAKRQSSCFVIRRTEKGTYTASGTYRCTRDRGFPSIEVIEREGTITELGAKDLIDEMQLICEGDWYHHYVPTKPRRHPKPYSPTNWWSIRMVYEDGTVRRWEGIDNVPPRIDEVYHGLVAMGMPGLDLEDGFSYAHECGNWSRNDDLGRISCYERLLGEAQELERDDETSEEVALVVGEFVEDVAHYLRANCPDFSLEVGFGIWHVVPELEALRTVDVRRAPRMQMLTLYGALTYVSDPRSLALGLVESGTLHAWGARLEELPREEYLETRHTDNEAHKATGAAVDEEVRRLIAAGGVFTARDVAKEVGCTTQHAAARIRTFLRRGDVKTVGAEIPRQYQAA